MKRSDTPRSSDTPTFKSINEALHLTIKHSVFSIMASRDTCTLQVYAVLHL